VAQTAGHNLLVDADDTLWENNVYFERVIARVQEMLDAHGVERAAFRACLDDLERAHIVTHGYGTLNFARSLVAAFERFLPPGTDGGAGAEVHTLALGILEHPIELLDGVAETLAHLAERHRLLLVTKGNEAEQSRKIAASGLAGYFSVVEILHEKHEQNYRDLVARHALDPSRTWMIGNSVRSDINPALAAGIHAVLIPHPHTWVLEREDAAHPARVLELERFADLRLHF
jgi:putative hydrolase of the HAD superfamily